MAQATIPPSLRTRLRDVIFLPGNSIRLEPDDRERLAACYQDDVHKLSRLLDRDLGYS